MEDKIHHSLIPVYTSKGDADAFLVYPYLYNRNGEWIGWLTQDREVYSVIGYYVGYLSNDPRILRKRATSTLRARLTPPQRPPRLLTPAIVALAPMMSELSYSVIDVLMEEPERLHTLDQANFARTWND